MALDSAAKRASAAGMHIATHAVWPDAAKDQAWRQSAAYAYSGILADEPAEIVVTPTRIYVVTAQNTKTRRKIEMFRDSAEVIQYDLRPWGTVSSVAWDVEYGMASISNEVLDSGQASIEISTPEPGRSMVRAIPTDGTRSLVLRLQVIARKEGFYS